MTTVETLAQPISLPELFPILGLLVSRASLSGSGGVRWFGKVTAGGRDFALAKFLICGWIRLRPCRVSCARPGVGGGRRDGLGQGGAAPWPFAGICRGRSGGGGPNRRGSARRGVNNRNRGGHLGNIFRYLTANIHANCCFHGLIIEVHQFTLRKYKQLL
jgi:hypothetical protein